ncbi:hypothetical protein CUMW_133230 [Citrus unshiu]|nr:hypothetical protein CUMW_133230 [Citrus unshiu]
MALVSQELVVYSDSRRDNIEFGKLDASENEVVKAARAANAHEFISILKTFIALLLIFIVDLKKMDMKLNAAKGECNHQEGRSRE